MLSPLNVHDSQVAPGHARGCDIGDRNLACEQSSIPAKILKKNEVLTGIYRRSYILLES